MSISRGKRIGSRILAFSLSAILSLQSVVVSAGELNLNIDETVESEGNTVTFYGNEEDEVFSVGDTAPYVEDEDVESEETDPEEETAPDEEDAETEEPEEEKGEEEDNTEEPEAEEEHEEAAENSVIQISTYDQLIAVGTGETVTEGDQEITYTKDGQYQLMNDIELDTADLSNIWTLPEDFEGTFVNERTEETDLSLYKEETDTIYIYNTYQLDSLARFTDGEDGFAMPVLSQDASSEMYGTGSGVPISEGSDTYLEYDNTHNYVLSQYFTEQLEDQDFLMDVLVGDGDDTDDHKLDGRDYVGQVVKKIDGTDYILIGNESQLRAIGTNTQVTPALYYYDDDKDGGTYIPLYPGDADLGLTWYETTTNTTHSVLFKEDQPDVVEQNGYYRYYGKLGDNPSESEVENYNKKMYTLADITMTFLGIDYFANSICHAGVIGSTDLTSSVTTINPDTGMPDRKNHAHGWIEKNYIKYKYSSDANYIIFRDIDLNADYATAYEKNSNGIRNDLWDPLEFDGTMYGYKGVGNTTKLSSITSISQLLGQTETPIDNPITVSNISIHPTGRLNPKDVGMGVGFFSTISEEYKNVGNDQTIVAGVNLNKIVVDNGYTEVKPDETLLSAILDGLGVVLGNTLGAVFKILGIIPGLDALNNLNIKDVIVGLLDIHSESADGLATGSFVGRLIGGAEIYNCQVTEASVKSSKNFIGGFAGYTEGETRYDALSNILDALTGLLEKILNFIPWLGLGDLITLLLRQNVLAGGQLFPVGYIRPSIKKSSVSFAGDGSTLGSGQVNYIGGFVGGQIGTDITDCFSSNLSQITAVTYAGGFAGISRDADVQGLLSSLGLDLVDFAGMKESEVYKKFRERFNPNSSFSLDSIQTNCKVTGSYLKVHSTVSYAGGFNGAMYNSTSEKCTVEQLSLVQAGEGEPTNDNRGNYVGGFTGLATVGYGIVVGDKTNDNTLTQTVAQLLRVVLDGGYDGNESLLSLLGVSPARILGCNVLGSDLMIKANGDYAGGFIGQGDGTQVNDDRNIYDKEDTVIDDTSKYQTRISGLKSVEARTYAGGIAGSLVTANPVGVLNNTVAAGGFIPFTLKNVSLTGAPLSVEASNTYAGGGIGLAIGGDSVNVQISELSSVHAKNYVGGFAGRSGTGALLKSGGVNLLGWNLLEITDVLSLAQGTVLIVKNTNVTGIKEGFTVVAEGETDTTEILAGGFLSEADGMKASDSNVRNLKLVRASSQNDKALTYAGGFVGMSHTGGLVGLAQKKNDGLELPGLKINTLVTLLPYLIPKYQNCHTSFVSNDGNAQVDGTYAGGFFGQMQSGMVNHDITLGISGDDEDFDPVKSKDIEVDDKYAVHGLEYVKGKTYAGGFAGSMTAGATAASGGIELLGGIGLKLNGLLSVLNVYVPIIAYAGVESADEGFIVRGTGHDSYAGGYVGYASGARINESDVNKLRHTKVVPPDDSLESTDGSNYYSDKSSYSVQGGLYAGGYVGCADLGSAAEVGGGLKVLEILNIDNLLSALDVVETKIEHSDVYGAVGGLSVLANGYTDTTETLGAAGGFIGKGSGVEINDCNVKSFDYIVGREYAGGFAGVIEPGNVASVVKETSILGDLITIQGGGLANLLNTFIPRINDSSTYCIPCGGAVRADGFTDVSAKRGYAGGYAGYNLGGQIKGSKGKECAAVRIRSVYGTEIAGGYTGLMEAGNLVETGGISVLFDLIKVDNPLGAISAVYPTETNTAVYGPLRKMSLKTWNSWAKAIAKNRVYGYNFPIEELTSEDKLEEYINTYAYGYNVRAGRSEAPKTKYQSGSAGGYVGRMIGGVITSAHADDARSVLAHTAAGGFVGDMETGGLADVGGISLGKLEITNALTAVEAFVPVIKNSGVTGYQSGLTVTSNGQIYVDNLVNKVGYSGGFAGKVSGGQIWGKETAKDDDINLTGKCYANNLRRINGTNCIGGFAGLIETGNVASVDTASSSGILSGLIQQIVKTQGDLLSVLNATISVVRETEVSAWDDYGLIVNGLYTEGGITKYAKYAGGYAGRIQGAVIGKKENEKGSVEGGSVTNLRSVLGGEYAGGFFGSAETASVAEVSAEGTTNILGKLLQLGTLDALSVFRPYIYQSSVEGSKTAGLTVCARTATTDGYVNSTDKSGNAGGFGGEVQSGTVRNGTVTNLRQVEGLNYTGGFIGHMGRGGLVEANDVGLINKIADLKAGVLDIIGSRVEDSSVTGETEGFIVMSLNNASDRDQIAGGFVGYADISQLERDTVTNLKQVSSGQTAGGFVGKTELGYAVNVNADSDLVNGLLKVVNTLVKWLQVDKAERASLPELRILDHVLAVQLLSDGDLLSLELLGLVVTVSLANENTVARVTIGDSVIELNCNKDGLTDEAAAKNELNVHLLEVNRARIESCSVTGIDIGYDVYGAGANNYRNGTDSAGYAGGFIGYNKKGKLENNSMILADVIRGYKGQVGPFSGSGKGSLDSNWHFATATKFEGNNNTYRIYRKSDSDLPILLNENSGIIPQKYSTQTGWKNVYTISHLSDELVDDFTDLKDAKMSKGTVTADLLAYREEGAMAVLMDNTPTEETDTDSDDIPASVQDPCDEYVQLEILKKWSDRGNTEKRPSSIKIQILRSYDDVIDQDYTHEVELNSTSDFEDEYTWHKIITGKNYPAYRLNETTQEKEYYTYTIKEIPVLGYTGTEKATKSRSDKDKAYSWTITNKVQKPDALPFTGAYGLTWWQILLIAAGASALTFVIYKRRKKKERGKSVGA